MSTTRGSRWRVLIQSAGVAVVAYLLAGATDDGRHPRAPAHRVGAGLDQRRRAGDRARRGRVPVAPLAGIATGARRPRAGGPDPRDTTVGRGRHPAPLLPALPSPTNGIEWAASLHSAGRIGGDLYDIIALAPGRWLLLVADVSGKGIPAAMAPGSLRASFRALAREHDQPAHVLALLSDIVYEAWTGIPYVTCIVARLDATSNSLTWANAGHAAGIVTRREGIQSPGCVGAACGPAAGCDLGRPDHRLRAGRLLRPRHRRRDGGPGRWRIVTDQPDSRGRRVAGEAGAGYV